MLHSDLSVSMGEQLYAKLLTSLAALQMTVDSEADGLDIYFGEDNTIEVCSWEPTYLFITKGHLWMFGY